MDDSLVDAFLDGRRRKGADLYRRIREYGLSSNKEEQDRLLSKLPLSTRQGVGALLKRRELVAAFDLFLKFPAMLDEFQIGNLGNLLGLRCDQLLINYLNWIIASWSNLLSDVDSDGRAMERIDLATVEALQLRAPATSNMDRHILKRMKEEGRIFSNFNKEEVEVIWNRLGLVTDIIPTLYSFFKDAWYLKSCVYCVKSLFPAERKKSLILCMNSMFIVGNREIDSNPVRLNPNARERDMEDIASKELFLYVMRNIDELKPRSMLWKGGRGHYRPAKDQDSAAWYRLALYAKNQGYASEEIKDMISKKSSIVFESHSHVGALAEDSSCTENGSPGKSVSGIATDEAPHRRCGRPELRAHEHSKGSLYVDKINQGHCSGVITSLFVRQCVFRAFFEDQRATSTAETSRPLHCESDTSFGLTSSSLYLGSSNDNLFQGQEHSTESEKTSIDPASSPSYSGLLNDDVFQRPEYSTFPRSQCPERARDYRVGWICAITTEYVAALELLDDEFDPPQDVPSGVDQNCYSFGRIGKHYIVVACLPLGKYGIASAATLARDMRRSFPSIQFGLMVGIGGGAPSKKNDIRLGDVVVGLPTGTTGGVIHYELGKTIQNQKFERMGSLDSPPRQLLAALQTLRTNYRRKGCNISKHVDEMITKNPRLREEYQRPKPESDILFKSTFVKDNDGEDTEAIVDRLPRESGPSEPLLHYGIIASADKLMKDAMVRDKLADEEGVMCFEMEAAGLGDFPCLVIRGICDYSDTHKNDAWQGHAAAAAAAYAKELLEVTAQPVQTEDRSSWQLEWCPG